MPRLMTYGDSNTHGTLPRHTRGGFDRYDEATRWPTRAAKVLGPDWILIEEGLPGRTAAHLDPVSGAHMDGQIGLRIALASQGPLDYLTIMLGTNDVKARFGLSPEQVVAGIAGLVDLAMSVEMSARHPALKILLIAPAAVKERGALAGEFLGGPAKSQAIPALLHAYAQKRGCGFLDANALIDVSEVDGVHLSPEAHGVLAHAVAERLMTL